MADNVIWSLCNTLEQYSVIADDHGEKRFLISFAVEEVNELLQHLYRLENVADKYQWHDFRNDPQDFPECNSTMVLAAMKEAYTGKIFYETFPVRFVKDFFCAQENNTQLIAWRLLEPFEVSE